MQTKTLIHVVLSSETDTDVRNKLSYGLHLANEHVATVAKPFPGIRKFETKLWESAQLRTHYTHLYTQTFKII
jgi:hypothetical protein